MPDDIHAYEVLMIILTGHKLVCPAYLASTKTVHDRFLPRLLYMKNRKQEFAVLAEAKYDGHSRQEAKIGELHVVYTL